MIFRFKRDRWSMSMWPYSKVARLSNARTGISVEFYLTPLNICFFTRASLWRLTAASRMLTMIFNLVLTSRGWLQERLDDFHPRLGADDAPPIFLRSSRFIIHTFMRRYTDLCIKILTGNTVSREFHESRHRRVNCKRLTKCICSTISSLPVRIFVKNWRQIRWKIYRERELFELSKTIERTAVSRLLGESLEFT